MSCISKLQASAALMTLLFWAETGHAASPGEKCQSAKLKTAGKYTFCRLKAESKSVKRGLAAPDAADLAKCEAKFSEKWSTAETKGGTDCPTIGDFTTTQDLLDKAILATHFILTSARFIDQGDGTILDTKTGLMWEMKNNADGVQDLSNPHDADNRYNWSNSDIMPDGSAFTLFLGALNNCISIIGGPLSGGFAGYCNWRLPTIAELNSLIDTNQCYTDLFDEPPCIDPIFTPTSWTYDLAGPRYWTAITSSSATRAFTRGFDNTSADDVKANLNWVRAVRDSLQPPVSE